jgi:hypothetical protein
MKVSIAHHAKREPSMWKWAWVTVPCALKVIIKTLQDQQTA